MCLLSNCDIIIVLTWLVTLADYTPSPVNISLVVTFMVVLVGPPSECEILIHNIIVYQFSPFY